MELRWYFDGCSMVVRWLFDGCSKDFSGFSLFSSNLWGWPPLLPVTLAEHPGTRSRAKRLAGFLDEEPPADNHLTDTMQSACSCYESAGAPGT
jgi:hypothetical protein